MTRRSPLVDAAGLAHALAGDRPPVVVDCRASLADPAEGRAAWRQAHVPGARHASLEDDLSGPHAAGAGRHPLPTPEAFAATLGRLGIGPDTPVVALDAGDGAMAAARLWWLLELAGHPGARVLEGGMAAWREAGLPLQSGEGANESVACPVRLWRTGLLADVDELRRRAAEAPGWLVDARARPRFRGEVEPIDPVAGHVPGAVNRPYIENLADGLRLKPAAELAAAFDALTGGRRPEDVVLMCGSGVTACHHALAMAAAGRPGARVFAPSWSGWIEDASRPVATGD
ncbi:MAG: sulfurtransferase [Lysobacteraceae bacterium]